MRVLDCELNGLYKVFSRGALHLCGCLDILKLTTNPLIYTVQFHISVCEGLELSLGWLSPKSYPMVRGLVEGFIFRFRNLSLGFGFGFGVLGLRY